MKLCLHAQKSLFCDYISAVFLQKKYYTVKGRISWKFKAIDLFITLQHMALKIWAASQKESYYKS